MTAGRQNNMAAKLRSERVPFLPKYRETLALEGRKSYDEKVKLIEKIDPYNVSNFLFSDSSPPIAIRKSNWRLIKA